RAPTECRRRLRPGRRFQPSPTGAGRRAPRGALGPPQAREGRSPTATWISRGSPPRRRLVVTAVPTRSGVSTATRSPGSVRAGPEGQNQVADADFTIVADGGGGHTIGLGTEHGDVEAGIAPGDPGRERPTVRGRERHLTVGFHGVARRDDDPGSPLHSGGGQA